MNLCLLSQGCCSCSSKFPMLRGASPLLPQPQQPVAEVIPSSWGRAFALPSMENLAAVRKAGERCFFNELMRQQPGISVPRRAHWTDELAPFSPETCRGEPWSPPDLALLPQQGVRDALLHPPGKPPQWLAPAPLPRPRSPPGGPGHAWVPPAVLHGHQAGHTWGCAPALADGETEARRSPTQRSPPGIPAWHCVARQWAPNLVPSPREHPPGVPTSSSLLCPTLPGISEHPCAPSSSPFLPPSFKPPETPLKFIQIGFQRAA